MNFFISIHIFLSFYNNFFNNFLYFRATIGIEDETKKGKEKKIRIRRKKYLTMW